MQGFNHSSQSPAEEAREYEGKLQIHAPMLHMYIGELVRSSNRQRRDYNGGNNEHLFALLSVFVLRSLHNADWIMDTHQCQTKIYGGHGLMFCVWASSGGGWQPLTVCVQRGEVLEIVDGVPGFIFTATKQWLYFPWFDSHFRWAHRSR